MNKKTLSRNSPKKNKTKIQAYCMDYLGYIIGIIVTVVIGFLALETRLIKMENTTETNTKKYFPESRTTR
ncbi:hypothetical protein [Olivibacter jilunii]|uniref:hypothetical protein n=1 Tax=Olivibacter jilunii TaxID=985016 RepID=UPI003F157D43